MEELIIAIAGSARVATPPDGRAAVTATVPAATWQRASREGLPCIFCCQPGERLPGQPRAPRRERRSGHFHWDRVDNVFPALP